jgi:origin recognition complex subunit 3
MICLPFHEIPTALVFAGINTPDHAAQFAHIASDLKQPLSETNERKRKNFVSFLQAKDCSNIKNMIKTMIERFLENTNEVVDQTEREEEDDNEDDDIIRTAQVKNCREREKKILLFSLYVKATDSNIILSNWKNKHERE